MVSHTTDIKTADSRTPLERLDTGLLTQYYHRQIKESSGVLSSKSSHYYSAEVRRTLDELRLTSALLKQVSFDDKLTLNGTVIRGENLINYYSGTFHQLVHQSKAQLLRLVDVMATKDGVKKPYPISTIVTASGLLRKHGKAFDKVGIKDLINDWSEDAQKSALKEVLDKYIPLDANYRAPVFNQAGIEYVAKRNVESFKSYQREILDKQARAIEIIETNIDQIAEKLTRHYKVPSTYEEQAKLSKEWLDHLAKLAVSHEVASII